MVKSLYRRGDDGWPSSQAGDLGRIEPQGFA